MHFMKNLVTNYSDPFILPSSCPWTGRRPDAFEAVLRTVAVLLARATT